MTRDQLRSRTASIVMVLIIGVLAFGAVAALRWADPETTADADETTTSTSTTATTAPTTSTTMGPQVPVSTPLATPKSVIPVYDQPDGRVVGEAGLWYGYDMTMPIVEERPGWLRIMLPERPNELTGWVRESEVTRSSTNYRIVTDISDTRTVVYKDGFEYFSFEVVVGKASTPTPEGKYFVAVIEKPGPKGYGPIVLDLNAHSEAIQSWQGSGDAIIAYHGPFGSQDLIRSGGGFRSNGCIRMLEEDQLKLAEIPLGTPVDLVA